MIEASSRRRYCFIGPSYPYRGGISHYNTCLIREFSGRAEVLTINFSRLYPGFLFPGKTQLDESGMLLAVQSSRLIDSLNPLSWIRAARVAAKFAPDAVIFQWWHPFFALALFTVARIAKFRTHARIVFVCHNVLPHERSLVDNLLSRLAFSAADAFVVQSRTDMATLRRLRPHSTAIVHPHPIYDFFARSSMTREDARKTIGEPQGPLVLFFGYIRPYKGLRYLIEALCEVRERVPARLLVVGEFYEDAEPYKKLVEKLGLSAAVRFVDRYVANEEVEQYFAASDLVVLPYISASQSGIVQIAIAFDRPVVVTDVGGLPEAVAPGETGFVVPPRDPKAISSAIVRFFEEGWADRMAPRFAEHKARFSWRAMADSIEKLLAEIPGRG